ncbi:hypothetical protein ACWGK1_41440 [Streptomyces wedmorensis]
MKHDNTAKPVTRTYPTGTHPALLTDAEARQTIEHLHLLEQLDPTGRGQAVGQLAGDFARRPPAP